MSVHPASTYSRVTASLLALVLLGCWPSGDRDHRLAIDRQADEVAIRDLLVASAAASTARDPAGVAATYTDDGDAWIAGLGSEPTVGREAIEESERAFTSMPGFRRWDVRVDRVRFISRDAAIAEVTGTTVMDGGEHPEKTTIVVARSPEGWRIAAWRVMEFDPSLLQRLRG